MGSARNMKITTPGDLELAEFFLAQENREVSLSG
jgi:2-C-methyl-D-erythritol 4-phosphate cytidylyltransferase